MELFIIDDFEDMHQAIATGNTEIVDLMFNAVKKGVKRNFKKVKLFEVVLRDDPEYAYDWYVEKPEYKELLESCLENYKVKEEYEKCAEVVKVLESIK